jgi:hypothetical protein
MSIPPPKFNQINNLSQITFNNVPLLNTINIRYSGEQGGLGVINGLTNCNNLIYYRTDGNSGSGNVGLSGPIDISTFAKDLILLSLRFFKDNTLSDIIGFNLCESLIQLELTAMNMDSIDISHISSSLKILDLSYNPFTSTNNIIGFTSLALNGLVLRGKSGGTEAETFISTITIPTPSILTLKDLDVDNSPLLTQITNIDACINLEQLRIDSTSISGIVDLSNLNKLEGFSVVDCLLTTLILPSNNISSVYSLINTIRCPNLNTINNILVPANQFRIFTLRFIDCPNLDTQTKNDIIASPLSINNLSQIILINSGFVQSDINTLGNNLLTSMGINQRSGTLIIPGYGIDISQLPWSTLINTYSWTIITT